MKIRSLVLAVTMALFASVNAWAGALEDAIRASDVEGVATAIQGGEDANAVTETGTPMIVLASSMAENDIAIALLDAGAEVDAMTAGDATALMYASGANNYILATRLIEAGADVDLRDTQGDPAINWGAYYGSIEYMRVILEADPDTSLRGHGNAYEITLRRGSEEAIRLIAEYNGTTMNDPAPDQDQLGRPLLHAAARSGNVEELSAMLASGVNVDVADVIEFTALMHSARDGQVESVQLLINQGADVNHRGHDYGLGLRPLHLAAIGNNTEIISALLDHGAEIDTQDVAELTPLAWAIFAGSHEGTLLLLQSGADWQLSPENVGSLRDIAVSFEWDDVIALMGE